MDGGRYLGVSVESPLPRDFDLWELVPQPLDETSHFLCQRWYCPRPRSPRTGDFDAGPAGKECLCYLREAVFALGAL